MQDKGIVPFAHTPLGGLYSFAFLDNEIITSIGKRIGASPAQVVLAYLLLRGIGVVISSKSLEHMIESINSSQFTKDITSEDIIG